MPIWLIPATYSALALAGGMIIPRLEHAYLASYLNDIAVASALAYLSAIASGMMAFTAIVFSIVYITVQFNAVAYSPRLAIMLANEPRLFHALGLFMATFLFALGTMAWVDRGAGGGVPLLSTLIVLILLVASTLQFAWLVRGVRDLQISNTLHVIGEKGRAVIAGIYPLAVSDPLARRASRDAERNDDETPRQIVRHVGEPRTIGWLDLGVLERQAQQAESMIEVAAAVGDTVLDDTVLIYVFGGTRPISESALLSAVHLTPQRTFKQDPKYAIRLLVDIAIKALSPAINDPTTAVQAIDEIEDLLRRLGRCDLDIGTIADPDGAVRVLIPMPTWEDYLRLAFDEIRQYGGASVQVVRRLRAALVSVAESVCACEDRLALVQRYVKQLDLSIDRSPLDAEDRLVASQEDRQGLGLSRKRETHRAVWAERRPSAVEPTEPGTIGSGRPMF